MSKGKIRGILLPSLYVMIIVVSFFSVAVLNNLLLGEVTNHDYSQSMIKNPTESVLKEQEDISVEEKKIYLPYSSTSIEKKVGYYNKDDDKLEQEKSLIYYQNTYMPCTGIVYSSKEEFDVIAVYDGIIKSIKQDEILGTVIEVSHNQNLSTYYYSLKDVSLLVDDEIKAGTILGKAAPNKIYENENNILFEVYYQGKSLNPEVFYNQNIDDLQ